MKMLKKITIVIALLLINAKLISAQTLSVGPIIGVNISKITPNSFAKNLAGLSIGALANYSVNEHFGLGAKLLFSQLGTAFSNSSEIQRLNYIQLPITAVYYFNDAGDSFRPKVFGGLYAGRLSRANNKNGNEILQTNGETLFVKTDIGGLIGGGFNYRLKSRTWLNMDATYSKSFTDITRNTGNAFYNSALSINVGVSFPVGKE